MISLKKAVSSLRKHLRNGWKATVKFASMKVFYPAVYRIHSLRPVDERRVVFVEVRMQSVSDNYALYYDTLKCGYDFDLHVHFLEELLVPMVVTYRRSIQALRDIARAKYVFINDATNMINAVHVRPETKVIQTWHACGPFKMFGYSVADLKFGATRRQMELYPIHRNYTHLILGGEARTSTPSASAARTSSMTPRSWTRPGKSCTGSCPRPGINRSSSTPPPSGAVWPPPPLPTSCGRRCSWRPWGTAMCW